MKALKFIIFNIVTIVTLIALIDLVSLVVLNIKNIKPEGKAISDSVINKCYSDVSWGSSAIKEWKKTTANYKAFVGWRRLPFIGQAVNIDTNGIRKTKQSNVCQNDLPNIVFLGGSTVWGSGVNDSNTIPSLFAMSTNSINPIVNYGETAYNAIQSYNFLQLNFLQGLKTNLIISYDGVNNSPGHTSKMFTHSREEQIIGLLKGADKQSFRSNILKPTRTLLSKVKRKLTTKPVSQKTTSSEVRRIEAAKELLDSWLLMLKLSNSNNSRFYCILQPNIFYGNPDTKHLPKSVHEHYYSNDYEYYDLVKELINGPKYQQLKPTFIDLSSALDDIPEVYIDFCHLNHIGNRIIAEKVIHHISHLNNDDSAGLNKQQIKTK